MPHQEALTIVAKVDPSRIAALEPVLQTLSANPGKNDVLPFGAVPSCHFGRLLFLPADKDLRGQPIAPQLLMVTDCDGTADAHLESLVDAAGPGLDRLFSHCEDYPRAPTTRADRLRFLQSKRVNTKANYVHRPGRSVEQIQGEANLRQELQKFVREQGLTGLAAVEVRRRLRAYVQSTPSLSWALEAPDGIGKRLRIQNALHATTLPLGIAATAPVLIPALAVLLGLVRLQEERDWTEHIRPTLDHARKLATLEDHVAHNGFTAGGFVKPGLVRKAVIRSVVPLIGYGTRHLFTRDSLAGVKTIHFARWIPLDGGRRVVFCSNYDGSLESYNNDFIDIVAWGLNLVFSNGYGYPKTRWLLFGGASREQEFKDFLRRHQIPTPIWYSAYPHLTAVNIERNAKLRAGLRGRMSEREAQIWLKLL